MQVEEDGDILPSEKLRTRERDLNQTTLASRSNGPVNITDDQNLNGSRRVSSAGSSDGSLPMDTNGGPHIGSSSSGAVRYSSSGRSDSLTRGMKPTYGSGYPLRRYGSSESMSSQSTLVNRTGYEVEDDPQQSITDLIGTGRSGLTRSQINAHMRSEARKMRHGYHVGGGGARGVASVGGGGVRVPDDNSGNGGGGRGERVVYYQRLHPELEYPYDEKMERRKQRSRRRHEVHGADTPDDEEGTIVLWFTSYYTTCLLNAMKMNTKVLNPLRLMLYVVKLMLFVQH